LTVIADQSPVEEIAISRAGKVPVSKAIALTVAAPMVLIAAYVALLQVPKTALELPLQNSSSTQVLTQVAPQGWAFFTKSPRSETIQVFVRDGTSVENAWSTPMSSPRNWFGLDRLPRAQGTEYATLLATQTEESWSTCTTLDLCTDSKLAAHPVANPVPSPTLCGDIYAIGYGATPWAWREFDYEPRQPERTLRMSVTC